MVYWRSIDIRFNWKLQQEFFVWALISEPPVLVVYWFSEGFLTQFISFCTSNIDDIIIEKGYCSHRRKLCGCCKFHDDFRITTSLYPFKKTVFVTGSHTLLYSLVLNVRALKPWVLPLSLFDGKCNKTQLRTNHHPHWPSYLPQSITP